MSARPYPEYKDSGQDWLGAIPEPWGVVPLWTLFTRVKRTGFENEELLSVYRDHGVVIKSSRDDNNNNASEDLAAYQLVEPGDLAVNKMKAWQGSAAISGHRGIVSPAYFIFRPTHAHHGRFLHYLMRSDAYVAQYARASKGVRPNQWDLDPQQHSRLVVLIPPRTEQGTIAAYLDAQTAKIDTLIGKQERLIETLAERRQAVISHAVTKGLEPHAPMKESGSMWFPVIPAHWELIPSSTAATLIQTGPFGSQLHSEEYVSGGTPVINPSHIVGGRIVPDDHITVDVARATELARHRLCRGDVVAARRGEMGRSAVVGEQSEGFLCGTGSLVIRLKPQSYLPEYFQVIFSSGETKAALTERSVGATMDNLSAEIVSRLRLPHPPLVEQQRIMDHLGRVTAQIDALSASAREMIDVLKERRQALISAAVTGKIDVRGLA